MTRVRSELFGVASAALWIAACADILGADFGDYGPATSGGGIGGADASSGGGVGGIGGAGGASGASGGTNPGGGSGGAGGSGGGGGTSLGGSGGAIGGTGGAIGGSGGATGGTGGADASDGAGDVNTDSGTDVSTDAPDATVGCPTLPGPVLRQVPAPGGGSYCIDSTEVSKTHYAAFLATNPTTANQPAHCAWNVSLLPTKEWPAATGTGDRPAVWLDWCDARAYCAAVGKRLCGKIGGGSTDFGSWNVAAHSQWFNACSSAATVGSPLAYPYGNSYLPTACNGNDNGASFDMLDVGSQPGCQSAQSGFSGVFDLSGNAFEWEDACSGANGPADKCRLRGGGTNESALGLRCDYDLGIFARDFTNDLVGFRCCYP